MIRLCLQSETCILNYNPITDNSHKISSYWRFIFYWVNKFTFQIPTSPIASRSQAHEEKLSVLLDLNGSICSRIRTMDDPECGADSLNTRPQQRYVNVVPWNISVVLVIIIETSIIIILLKRLYLYKQITEDELLITILNVHCVNIFWTKKYLNNKNQIL